MKYLFIAIDRVLYALLITIVLIFFLFSSTVCLIIRFIYDFNIDKEFIELNKETYKEFKKHLVLKEGISDFIESVIELTEKK